MAKYELQPIQSMYRDTGSVQINQMKRQEFLSNLQADNTLATSVMNMEHMEEDTEAINNLADTYNSNIETRGQRKDYENLGMSINKDAMNFVKDYNPYKKSFDLHKAYKTSLDEDYENGKITAETRDGRMRQSKMNYQGIQKTASGVIDRDSYFKGAGYVQDVDINEAIINEFKDVDIRMLDLTDIETLRDATFRNVFDKDAGKAVWQVQSGDKIEGVPDHVVEKVMNLVMSRSDVKNTLAQQAELETFDTLDPEKEFTDLVKNYKSQITKLKNKKDLDKDGETVRDNAVTSLEDLITNLERIKVENSTITALKNNRYIELQGNYRDMATGKYAYENITRVLNYKLLDPEGVGVGSQETVPTVIMQAGAPDALSAEAIGGPTRVAKDKYIAEQDAVIKSVVDNEIYSTLESPLQSLYNVNNDEEMESLLTQLGDNAPDKSILMRDINKVKRARDQKDIVLRQLAEAKELVRGDLSEQEYHEQESKVYENRGFPLNNPKTAHTNRKEMLTFADIRDIMIEEGAIPEGSTIYEALESIYYDADPDAIGGSAYSSSLSVPSVAKAIHKNLIDKGDMSPDIDKKRLNKGDLSLQHVQHVLRQAKEEFTKNTEKDREVIEGDLKDAQIKYDGQVDLSFADPEDKTRTTIHNVLKTRSLPSDVQVFGANGEKIAFGTYIDNEFGDTNNYKIIYEQTGLVNVASPDGSALIRVVVQDLGKSSKEEHAGKTRSIFINANELQTQSITKFTNDVPYKVERLWGTGRAGDLRKWPVPVFGGSVVFDYVNDEIIIDGKPYTSKVGKEKLTEYIREEKLNEYIY